LPLRDIERFREEMTKPWAAQGGRGQS